jgi:hypothetical protein
MILGHRQLDRRMGTVSRCFVLRKDLLKKITALFSYSMILNKEIIIQIFTRVETPKKPMFTVFFIITDLNLIITAFICLHQFSWA